MWIDALYRYPVKGLSAERLPRVELVTVGTFPADRQFALLRSDAALDPAAPAWLPKTHFLMLMMHEALATVRTRYDATNERLSVDAAHGTRHFDVGTSEGRAAVETFFHELVPGPRPRWVSAAGHSFSDKPNKYVSLINLASLRELERRWSVTLEPLRFRANVYIDGAEPFSELTWVGRELSLGSARALVHRRNGRCAATNVHPDTGARDRDVPGRLRAEFAHKDLGVYLSITAPGTLAEGDTIRLEPAASSADIPPPTPPPSETATRICSACYHLLPDNPDPSTLPVSYRCPDCGAGPDAVVSRAEFRPLRR
jgi:GntR family transcriptional regulator / MocR family aminotransferase